MQNTARVYPRAYGETSVVNRFLTDFSGLSPRLRGNRAAVAVGAAVGGSIPALTGKPGPRSWCRRRRRVYPRAYGETHRQQSVSFYYQGLSPRLRGNPSRRRCACTGRGSIPALTGKPIADTSATRRQRVYPRAYGETSRRRRLGRGYRGLSPRLRGNPEQHGIAAEHVGSIPALTGKPRGRSRRRRRCWVYPRAYGETTRVRHATKRRQGLSPRLRGNHLAALVAWWRSRSIPALTGKPGDQYGWGGAGRVYPRAYGETVAGE